MKVLNKKASYKYQLGQRYEAGISLLGAEVKAFRNGGASLVNSFGKAIDGEIFLVNANISVTGKKDYNPTRSRKLLLHKNQITSIMSKIKAKRLTLVPTKMYTKGRLVKVEIALAKPKKVYEKKEILKRKSIDREIERELKER